MKTVDLSIEQLHRFEKLRTLARTKQNLTLTLTEPHRNPYRDLPATRLRRCEENVKRAFMDAIIQESIAVIISADEHVRSTISYDFTESQKSKGRILRLVVKNKQWFENNWSVFAGDFGFGTRRSLFVFLKFNEETLSRLTAPWWDPDVLLNPGTASSRALLKNVRSRIEPGTIVFSLSLVRLMSCQLYFHSHDVNTITLRVCAAAQKTKWWK